MTYLQMGLHLETVVVRSAVEEAVLALFRYAEAEGIFPEMVKSACRDKRKDSFLWATAAKYGLAPGGADSPSEVTASVKTGLRALAELLQEREVRDKVVVFLAVIRGADRRINIVGDYKDLHDRLHSLQLKCFYPMLSAQRSFPQDNAKVQIGFYAITLTALISEMNGIVCRGTLVPDDFQWIKESLEVASVLLVEALAGSSVAKLDEAVGLISDELRWQPQHINGLLIQAARELDLANLYEMLRQVNEALQTHGADENQLFWFNKGVADLTKLDAELGKQISEHRTWQRIDNDLWLASVALRKTNEEFKDAWKTLYRKVAKACDGVAEEWAEVLRKTGGFLSEAVEAGDSSHISFYFPEFSTRVIERFYAVDIDLKSLCGKLRPIGDELHTVMEVVQKS